MNAKLYAEFQGYFLISLLLILQRKKIKNLPPFNIKTHAEKSYIAALRLLSLEGPAYKVGPKVSSGNLALEPFPNRKCGSLPKLFVLTM